jgi:GNAT superfamily N-acetyltransferase
MGDCDLVGAFLNAGVWSTQRSQRGRRQGEEQEAAREENMMIDHLGPEDAAVYQELRLLALQESPAAFGSSYAEEVDRPLEVIEKRLADARNHVFGAFDENGRLVGMTTLRREERVRSKHKAFLFGMYVLPKHRKQGMGRALLEAVISRAEKVGIRQVNLTVNSENRAAVLLYESCGFEQFGLERDAFRIEDGFFDTAYMVLRVTGDN